MKTKQKIINSQKGTTVVEVIVGIGLVSMLAMALYLALFNAVRLAGDAKQKTGAVALANEKMETIRNLEYDSIGLIGWSPEGPIEAHEELTRNGFHYVVDTEIRYVDDPFDGTASDTDAIPNDYKQARVLVSWQSGVHQRQVSFVSKFIPDGLETLAGGGTLSVNVIDSTASYIEGAVVQVDSVNDTPAMHGSITTDSSGNARLVGFPQQEYQITVSKDGYETVQTYPAGSGYTPADPNIIVIDGAVVLKTFMIDQVGDLTLQAVDIADESGVSGIEVELQGGRKIGTDPETFSFSSTDSTDSSGQINHEDIGPGNYSIMNSDTFDTDDYAFVGAEGEQDITLAPGGSESVRLVFAQKAVDSLLVRVVDINDNPIEGAQVRVQNGDSSFDQVASTMADGRVYFPTGEDPSVVMTEENYTIDITADTYDNYSGSEDIIDLTQHEAAMTAVL